MAGLNPAVAEELPTGAPAGSVTPPSRPRRHIARFVLRRLAYAAATLWLISVLVFAATRALPGDTAQAILGREAANPERLAAVRAELDLDRPLVTQYGSWLGGLLTGDLGTSLASRPPQPVESVLAPRVARSLALLAGSALVAIPAGIGVGIWTAVRRDRLADRITSGTVLVVAALPEFVLGVALVAVLATGGLRIFPAVSLLDESRSLWQQVDRLALPVLTLAIAVIPYLARMTRATMIEVLDSDYVEMARLKGMPERRVLLRHALPNAVPPLAQVVALMLAYLAGGTVVIEQVFQFPGIGLSFLEAVRVRDLPVVQDVALLIAAVYVVVNLLADLAALAFTPRLRTTLA